MKVIRSGVRWEKYFECTGMGNSKDGCNSILLVDGCDLYYKWTGNNIHVVVFQCPECGAETRVRFPDSFNVSAPTH